VTHVQAPSPLHPALRQPSSLARTLPALYELAKPRIARLVTMTAAMGFALGLQAGAAPTGGWAVRLLFLMIGTFLSAGGANALNQWMERDRDARMDRTSGRPIPSGRVTPSLALAWSVGISVVGVAVLAAGVGWPAAIVSALTILSYTFLYTPLKPVTHWATQIGAGPGAAGPLIGWLGAFAGDFQAFAHPMPWVLFLLMVVWQIPHFLAIAWMHRDDYARGGFRVLPVVDPSGVRVARGIALWTGLLVVLTPLPVAADPTGRIGWLYLSLAFLAVGVFAFYAFRAAITRTRPHARAAFLASLIYLPLALGAMVVDAIPI